jgi:hypothetical protein
MSELAGWLLCVYLIVHLNFEIKIKVLLIQFGPAYMLTNADVPKYFHWSTSTTGSWWEEN